MNSEKRILIITGHYGSGKTNIAVNLSLQLVHQSKRPVTIVDLDIVNPYFRTADFTEVLEREGIRVISPLFARSNLDSPALSPEIGAIFAPDAGPVVIDVGGDDAGAIALGQFAPRIEAAGYEMYYVINARRYLTKTPEETAALLLEIEATSRLRATQLINNTNLGVETTAALLLESVGYAQAVSMLTGLPIAYTCAPLNLSRALELSMLPGFFPVTLYTGRTFDE